MTLRPCLICSEPTNGPRCPEHRRDTKPTAARRGYNNAWTRLSKRARRLQPFCSDCGATEDLQTDHTPEAWARKAAGKAIRLQDVEVVCGPCNRARGAARGTVSCHDAIGQGIDQLTRGDDPSPQVQDPRGTQNLRYTPVGGEI